MNESMKPVAPPFVVLGIEFTVAFTELHPHIFYLEAVSLSL